MSAPFIYFDMWWGFALVVMAARMLADATWVLGCELVKRVRR